MLQLVFQCNLREGLTYKRFLRGDDEEYVETFFFGIDTGLKNTWFLFHGSKWLSFNCPEDESCVLLKWEVFKVQLLVNHWCHWEIRWFFDTNWELVLGSQTVGWKKTAAEHVYFTPIKKNWGYVGRKANMIHDIDKLLLGRTTSEDFVHFNGAVWTEGTLQIWKCLTRGSAGFEIAIPQKSRLPFYIPILAALAAGPVKSVPIASSGGFFSQSSRHVALFTHPFPWSTC